MPTKSKKTLTTLAAIVFAVAAIAATGDASAKGRSRGFGHYWQLMLAR